VPTKCHPLCTVDGAYSGGESVDSVAGARHDETGVQDAADEITDSESAVFAVEA